MISVRGVHFSYDGKHSVLDIPQLDIGPGLTVVVGPNGAGKSTLLRVIAGVERPPTGAVAIGKHDLWRDEVAARRLLAYVPEYPDLTPYATIADVMRLVAGLRNEPLSVVPEILDRVGLLQVAWRTIRELSMGQRRRAMFAMALVGKPPVVILDEPLETMDLAMRDLIIGWIAERRDAGDCIVVATHDLEPFAASADAVIAVSGGAAHVVVLDPAARLQQLERLALG